MPLEEEGRTEEEGEGLRLPPPAKSVPLLLRRRWVLRVHPTEGSSGRRTLQTQRPREGSSAWPEWPEWRRE